MIEIPLTSTFINNLNNLVVYDDVTGDYTGGFFPKMLSAVAEKGQMRFELVPFAENVTFIDDFERPGAE